MGALHTRILIFSEVAYRLLLLAYPLRFRQRFGPEMAQVFRTCCRAAYNTSGTLGVVCLWLPTLWDWAWTAANEWLSSILKWSVMKNSLAWLGNRSKMVLYGLIVCLPLLFCFPAFRLFSAPIYLGVWTCTVDIDNQSGKTLRITPVDSDHTRPHVRLFRTSGPTFPAFRQKNIEVNPGDVGKLAYDCEANGPLEMVACDLEGECYLKQNRASGPGDAVFRYFLITDLASLPRPDEALLTAFQSFPEQDYSGLLPIPFAILYLIIMLVVIFRFVRGKTRVGFSG